MKLVQSWVDSCVSNNRSLLSNLLILYLSQYNLNNANIFTEFYTNKKFLKYIDGLKFSKIDVDILNNIPSNNKCFAYGKMLVLQNTPLDTVHFDCDILIKDVEKIKEIQDSEWDGVSWSIETALNDHNGDYLATHTILNMFTDNKYGLDEKRILNTGFLGFRNQKLKDLFLEQYFHNTKMINNRYEDAFPYWQRLSDMIVQNNGENNTHIWWSPTYDLVLEQVNYTQIVDKYNFKVFTLHREKFKSGSNNDNLIKKIDGYDTSVRSHNYKYWKEDELIGIRHYFGYIKNTDDNIRDFYYQLKKTSYYSIFIKNISQNIDIMIELYNIVKDDSLYSLMSQLREERIVNIYNDQIYDRVAICMIAKNTPDYLLKEWINHHHKLGIRDIHIYVDLNSTPLYQDSNTIYHYIDLKDKLNYITSGRRVDVTPTHNSYQIGVYNEFLHKYRDKYDWICFIDDDEFLDLSLEKLKLYEDYSSIYLPEKIYYTLSINKTNLSNYRELDNNSIDKLLMPWVNIKSIINTHKCENIHSEHFGDFNGILINTNKYFFHETIIDKQIAIDDFRNSKALGDCIHHYHYRSLEEIISNTYDRCDNQLFNFTDSGKIKTYGSTIKDFFKFLHVITNRDQWSIQTLDHLVDTIGREDVKLNPLYPSSPITSYEIEGPIRVIYCKREDIHPSELKQYLTIKNIFIINYIDLKIPNTTWMNKNFVCYEILDKLHLNMNEIESINKYCEYVFKRKVEVIFVE